MTPQPKPAKGGADAHRQQDRADEDEDDGSYEQAITPTDPGSHGGDGGGGGGGGQPPSNPGAGGTFAGFPVKKVALAGGVLLAGFILWKLMQDGAISIDSGDEEGEDPSPDPEMVEDDPTDVVIQQRPEDPLAADHEAGQFVFGWDS